MAETESINKKTEDENKQDSTVKDVIDSNVNTDGRKAYDWESKYPETARNEMKREACYIGLVLIVSLLGLLFSWCGLISRWLVLGESQAISCNGIMLYFFAGLLGGTIYGVKYFYRVVARGYWTQDRKYWRIFSPWISACISLVVGSMVVSGYINATQEPSTSTGICIGFIAGYFADDAVGKMSEVATALFGTSSKVK